MFYRLLILSMCSFFVAPTLLNGNSLQKKKKAFAEFYDHEKIESHLCQENVFHFLVEGLEGVPLNRGFVVGFKAPMLLAHFDARWGDDEVYSTEEAQYIPLQWSNGSAFTLSNYYHHVFLILDKHAYDFSQAGRKVQTIKSYLKKVYFPPKKASAEIFLKGLVDFNSVLANYQKNEVKMIIYPIDEYKVYGTSAEPIYEGLATDLFKHYKVIDGSVKKLAKILKSSPTKITKAEPSNH